ncbi:CHRD domain-containing protein [Haladaptatus halobius]|uniref:CHRD domain-containing protein n=1 Tax=Haladaptatus halobius TaxID=2884875 RepID=UPI001D0A4BA3|nr:CHRD domain-containing protein [Haladaptatus halobius]
MLDRRDVLKAGVSLGAGAGVVTAQSQDGTTLSAGRMTGDEQPDTVETNAEGAAVFVREGPGMRFILLATGIENVTQAHIHRGSEGENGPVVTWLYPDPQARQPQRVPGRFDGVLSARRFFAGDLVGPLEGRSLDSLTSAIENGNAYVNVHTKSNPAGEIRGQLSSVSTARVRFRQRIGVDAGDGFGVSRSVGLQVQGS